jgi:anti-sigma regulatory factor (Ser/Thr protein kinase)
MPTQIDQVLPAGPEAVATAREAVDRLAPGICDQALDDLRLLVSEVVTNSLRHGRGLAEEVVALRVAVEGDRARAEVLDGGPGFEPPPSGPRPRGDAGWGLVLVDALAERWGVERREGTRVWFELRLDRGCDGGSGTRPAPAGTV